MTSNLTINGSTNILRYIYNDKAAENAKGLTYTCTCAYIPAYGHNMYIMYVQIRIIRETGTHSVTSTSDCQN